MYQKKGLAEIVRNPSKITRKYLDIWFTGKGSFGRALKMLGWPISEINSPLLQWKADKGLLLDLKSEQETVYSNTIYHYVKVDKDCILKIDFKKILIPGCIWGTIKSIWSQSKLLINFQKTYNLAKKYVESIPLEIPKNKEEIEDKLLKDVWPKVIAVDYIGEFIYSVMVNKLDNNQKIELISKLQAKISSRDWYTKAILSWNALQEGRISKNNFLAEYGFAADDDYELTRPRYYEILKSPKPVIKKIKIEEMKITKIEDLYVGMQYLRSEAKRKCLVWISALRDTIFLIPTVDNDTF